MTGILLLVLGIVLARASWEPSMFWLLVPAVAVACAGTYSATVTLVNWRKR